MTESKVGDEKDNMKLYWKLFDCLSRNLIIRALFCCLAEGKFLAAHDSTSARQLKTPTRSAVMRLKYANYSCLPGRYRRKGEIVLNVSWVDKKNFANPDSINCHGNLYRRKPSHPKKENSQWKLSVECQSSSSSAWWEIMLIPIMIFEFLRAMMGSDDGFCMQKRRNNGTKVLRKNPLKERNVIFQCHRFLS